MEGVFFNVNNGSVCSFPSPLPTCLTRCSYLEGIVRGYRNTLLTSQQYSNLVQCDTIDGMSTSRGLAGGPSLVLTVFQTSSSNSALRMATS